MAVLDHKLIKKIGQYPKFSVCRKCYCGDGKKIWLQTVVKENFRFAQKNFKNGKE
jgi:hypothetical protein